MRRDTVTLQVSPIENSMDFGAETQTEPVRAGQLPPFPKIWVGYLLGVATFISEVVAVTLHPELANGGEAIPPLYLFLAIFVGGVYWLVCVYQYHVLMSKIPGR